jgi:hypothetical protein
VLDAHAASPKPASHAQTTIAESLPTISSSKRVLTAAGTVDHEGWCCASQHSLQIHWVTRLPSAARLIVWRHACSELTNV